MGVRASLLYDKQSYFIKEQVVEGVMEVYGTLVDFSLDGVAGMEGIHWSIRRAVAGLSKEDQIDDYYLLEEGSFLEIYDPETLFTQGVHKLIWSGYILKDAWSNLMAHPHKKGLELQYICNKQVSWLQKDFDDHEQWYWFFALRYPAKLVFAEPSPG